MNQRFGPSQISQSRAGGGSLNVSIQYDNYGNVLSVSPI